ncbi:MAG: MarR family transcriptional regulator [Clostridia bacterium]|jgi:DNA-binding MarR family transcriptional regulator|nr:MarR family transcriptional regulator [Clostridia bacterium]
MFTQQDAEAYLEKIRKNRPIRIIDKLAENEKGIWCVLVFIDEQEGEVYAKEIADEMKISRARAGVLVDKLANRGLLEKYPSKVDNRITALKITKEGKLVLNDIKDKFAKKLIEIVDEIGEDDFKKFFEISKKIENVLRK